MNRRSILKTFPFWIIIVALGLLAIFAWQVAAVSSGQISPSEQVALTAVAASGTTSGDRLADLHPADRKLSRIEYVIGTERTPNVYSLDEVHPADRTFFYVTPSELSTNEASRHPADRKFFSPTYSFDD